MWKLQSQRWCCEAAEAFGASGTTSSRTTGRSSLPGSLAAGRSLPVPQDAPQLAAPGQKQLWLFHLSLVVARCRGTCLEQPAGIAYPIESRTQSSGTSGKTEMLTQSKGFAVCRQSFLPGAVSAFTCR